MSLEVRERVVRLDEAGRWSEAVQLLASNAVSEIFLDASNKPASRVLEEAMNLARVLWGVRGKVKPIVVGPLSELTAEMDRHFAKLAIRTTGFTFEAYIQAMCDHCDFVDAIRADYAKRRAAP